VGADVVIGAVTDKEIVSRCMKDIDIVHHTAAAFRELDVSQSYYHEVNVGGTRNVLEAAYDQKAKRFIYCSTCGVHGNIDNPPADEDTAIKPADYYQQTKYEAEPLVNQYFEKGMKTIILRPAGIYGLGDPEPFFMIFKRVTRGTFPMCGSGKTYYHSLYIDNLVDAFMLSMQDGRGDGETYLMADEEFVEIEDLVWRAGKVTGVDVRIPHFPLLPLVIGGHICEKVCRPFGIAPPIFCAGWTGIDKTAPSK